MRHCVVILSLLTVVLLVLTSCGGTPTPTGIARIALWHAMTGNNGDAINQLTAVYNQSQTRCMAESVVQTSD